MGEMHIGAGGWGYFAGGLEAYARAFGFVEVNATFYRRVSEAQARGWRTRVPSDFVFAVKANRVVSHRDRLRATAGARAAFSHDVRIATILRAPFLILETPPDLAFEDPQREALKELSSMVDETIRVGLEARHYRKQPIPASLRATMEDLRIVDVVDASQSRPRVANDVVYTRLFGPGPHNVYEFDDSELQAIDEAGHDAVRAAFTFHGVRMYKDAARFLTFKRTETFPPATDSRGLRSLEDVMRPDARFPAARDALLRDHGWKVIDLDDATRAHASRTLSRLPDRVFASLDEVVRELESRRAVPRRESAGADGPPRTTPH